MWIYPCSFIACSFVALIRSSFASPMQPYRMFVEYSGFTWNFTVVALLHAASSRVRPFVRPFVIV